MSHATLVSIEEGVLCPVTPAPPSAVQSVALPYLLISTRPCAAVSLPNVSTSRTTSTTSGLPEPLTSPLSVKLVLAPTVSAVYHTCTCRGSTGATNTCLARPRYSRSTSQ